jgi:hypothetical protein
MKKLILITVLFMIYSMNANSVVLYVEDDMGSGGGYSGYYTPPPSSSITITGASIDFEVVSEINSRKSEIRTAITNLRYLLIYETDPVKIQEYNNQIAAFEQEIQVIQQQVQINLESVIDNQSYILNLLSNIMKMLHDMISQITRNF